MCFNFLKLNGCLKISLFEKLKPLPARKGHIWDYFFLSQSGTRDWLRKQLPDKFSYGEQKFILCVMFVACVNQPAKTSNFIFFP